MTCIGLARGYDVVRARYINNDYWPLFNFFSPLSVDCEKCTDLVACCGGIFGFPCFFSLSFVNWVLRSGVQDRSKVGRMSGPVVEGRAWFYGRGDRGGDDLSAPRWGYFSGGVPGRSWLLRTPCRKKK